MKTRQLTFPWLSNTISPLGQDQTAARTEISIAVATKKPRGLKPNDHTFFDRKKAASGEAPEDY